MSPTGARRPGTDAFIPSGSVNEYSQHLIFLSTWAALKEVIIGTLAWHGVWDMVLCKCQPLLLTTAISAPVFSSVKWVSYPHSQCCLEPEDNTQNTAGKTSWLLGLRGLTGNSFINHDWVLQAALGSPGLWQKDSPLGLEMLCEFQVLSSFWNWLDQAITIFLKK